MIYTVGHTENYNTAIKEHGAIFKMGETVEYEGGIVFESHEDATVYLEQIEKTDEWSVWGVDADWIMDTYHDGTWNYLLFDSEIIPLGDN